MMYYQSAFPRGFFIRSEDSMMVSTALADISPHVNPQGA
jgi:hypothetical protein